MGLNRQFNTSGSQLFLGGGYIASSLISVKAAIFFSIILQAQLLANHGGVVAAIRHGDHAVGSISVVLAGLRIDEVGAGQIVGHIQAPVPGLAEVLVGNGGVPLLIGITILILTVIVKVPLIRILGGTGFNQVVMELIGGIVIDGGQVGLVQLITVNVAGFVQQEGLVSRFDHLHGDGVEQLIFLIVVEGVGSEDLEGAIHELAHIVRTIVPQGIEGHIAIAVCADLFQQSAADGAQAGVGGNSGEVAQRSGAGVHDGVIIGSRNADHLQELVQTQIQSGLLVALGQGLGVLIVVARALDHFDGHGGVGGLVLGVVQSELQAPQEVFTGQGSHLVAFIVDPHDVVAEVEGPVGAVVGGPILGHAGDQVAIVVVGQQTVDAVAQHVQVNSALGMLDAPILNFAALQLVVHIVGDFIGMGDDRQGRHHAQHQHEGKQLLHVSSS